MPEELSSEEEGQLSEDLSKFLAAIDRIKNNPIAILYFHDLVYIRSDKFDKKYQYITPKAEHILEALEAFRYL